MKKITLILLALISLNAFGQELYTEKTGKIGYKFTMGEVSSEYLIVYDDFGAKQSINTTTVIDGETTKAQTIITPDNIFMVNHEEKTIMKMPADMQDSPMAMGEDDEEEFDISEFTQNVNKHKNSKQGTADILGKTCDIYSISEEGMKGKYWIWKTYMLKAEFASEGVTNTIEATEFAVNIDVPAKTFVPPAGYTLTDLEPMMKQMQQMMNGMQGMPGMPAGE